MRKTGVIGAALCLLLFFSGCQTQENTPPEIFIHTLRFWDGDRLLLSRDVPAGSLPEIPAPTPEEGCAFFGWDRELPPVSESGDYYGIFRPDLRLHVPYLLPKADGLLHPKDPFAGDDLRTALGLLSGNAERLPALSSGELTGLEVREALSYCMPGKDLPDADSRILTRGEAAGFLNLCLGRQNHTVTLTSEIPFPDLSPFDPCYADLMEAAMPHTEGSTSWETVLLPTGHAPGWEISEGIARYYDEYGYLLTDTTLPEGAALDSQGRATTGNEELDAFGREILQGLQEKSPDISRFALLEAAYDYVRDTFTYIPIGFVEYGATGWQTDYALHIFRNGTGNCYYYSAAFASLAQLLGYDAWAVSGKLLWDEYKGCEPHSFVEIRMNGELFYFDPEAEMASRKAGISCRLFNRQEYNTLNILYLEKGRELPSFRIYKWWKDL